MSNLPLRTMPNSLRFLIFVLLSVSACFAQDTYDPARALSSEELFLKYQPNYRTMTRPGQRYLVLDTHTMLSGFQRHRFFVGDDINLKIRYNRRRMQLPIASLTDSTFSYVVINELARTMDYVPVKLTDVRRVRVARRIPWVTEGSVIFPLAGLLFVAADLINPGMDGRRFTTDPQALMVGGALVGGGLVCYTLSFPNYRVGRTNRLKVLQTY